MQDFYVCESHGRRVTVWPCITGESGFYDVVYGDVGDDANVRTSTRLTVTEAAAFVMTELGVPHGETINSLAGMIVRALRCDPDNVRDQWTCPVSDDIDRQVSS